MTRPGSPRPGLNEQSGLNCTGHAPSLRGPGYRRVYGETTKHASEASVLKVGHRMVDDFAGVVLDDDEGEDLPEQGNVGLHEIAGPDLVSVVPQEGRPLLPTWRRSLPRLSHVLFGSSASPRRYRA
jgi:hypothetical protein